MTINNISACPDCGGYLKYYDKVSRIVRTKGGIKHWTKVKRYKCIVCRKLHRVLPDYIFPYKHYSADIITGVLNGTITTDNLEFEDYPSEITMKRWARK